MSEHKDAVDAKTRQLQQLEARIADARLELAFVRGEITRDRREHETILASLASLRQKVAAI